MANTYTWKIESLECNPSSNGQSNVVSVIHWRCQATDGKNTAETYNVIPLPYVAGTFINYANLTETTVIGWLQNQLGQDQVTKIQTTLDNQLTVMANPPVVYLPLPWTS